MTTLQELKEKRNALADSMLEISSHTMSVEEKRRFDALDKEQNDLARQIDALERATNLDRHLRSRIPLPQNPLGGYEQPELVDDPNYIKAFRNYLLTGERRDLSLTTATESLPTSVLVPQAFSAEIEKAMKYAGPMLQVCRVQPTATGAPLPWPTSDDTGNEASIVGEGTQVTELDATLSAVVFGAYKYTTGLVKVSLELLQDANFPLESWLAEQFGRRLGRKLNADFTNGTGTGQPKGVLTAATAGPTATGSSTNTGGAETGANSIGTDDLVALAHSVDILYRPNAIYQANDDTIKAIQQLKDKYGRPIFELGEGGKLATIFGYPLLPNNDLATIATGAKTMLFGDFSRYVIRRVKDLSIVRLTERFADFGQVGFIGFARYDGNLIDAGTHPIKYLVQA